MRKYFISLCLLLLVAGSAAELLESRSNVYAVQPVFMLDDVAAEAPVKPPTGTYQTSIFSNTDGITIPVDGVASPFPSTIDTGTLPGAITDVNVSINGFAGTAGTDIILQSPSGTFVTLYGGSCASGFSNRNYTFDDAASETLNFDTCPDSGTFLPSQAFALSIDDRTTLPDERTYEARLSALNDEPAAGTWSLYVYNLVTAVATGGSIASWSLEITTQTNLIAVSDVSVNEGAGSATITVSRSAASGTSTVGFSTANGSATTGNDYTTASGTLTFSPGITSRTINVDIIDDTRDEAAETYFVNLSNPVNATITDGQGLVTITDNDATPTISINNSSVAEDTGIATFTVTLSAASGLPISIDFATLDDSATAGNDYAANSGTLNFVAGEISQTISINISNDVLAEGAETYFVNLSNPTNAIIVNGQGLGTIIDDDDITPPVVTVVPSDIRVNNDPGLCSAVVTYSVSALDNVDGPITPVLVGGQASGSNFPVGSTFNIFHAIDAAGNTGIGNSTVRVSDTEAPTIGTLPDITLIVPDGETSGIVTYADPIFNDNCPNSILRLREGLASGSSFLVGTTLVRYEIIDIGGNVNETSFNVTVVEDAAPVVTVPADITVSNDADTCGAIVNYSVSTTDDIDSGLPITQTSGNLSGSVFPVGTTINQFEVIDSIGNIGLGFFEVTVTDNQNPTIIAPADINMAISAFETSVIVTYADPTIMDNCPNLSVVQTGGLASGDAFPVGTTINQFEVTDANGNKANTSFSVTVSAASLPTITINDTNVDEAAGTATFTIIRSGDTAGESSIDYATADDSAMSSSDYISVSGTLNFDAGETSQTVTVTITDDALDEDDETFTVNLSNAVNATINDNQGVGTITDNDGEPTFTINDVTVNETDGTATFTVTLSTASGKAISVDFATADDSALAGSDYTINSGTLNFAAGETSQSVTVNITDDALDEADETFTVNLSNAVNATTNDNQGVGTITDDDAPPTISINDVTVAEGDGTATFTVTLSAVSGQTISVAVATADDSATAGNDYAANTGALIFMAGETTQSFTVNITDDALDEVDETFTVNLSNAVNATTNDNQGVGTITDNDGEPTFTINDVTINEADGTATFTVTLSAFSGQQIMVDFATADDSALAGSDYTINSGTLNFAAGETSQSVTVDITDDVLDEVDETFTVNLSNAVNATINDNQGVGTITDNDGEPTFTINDVTVNETDGTATFTVTLSAISGQQIMVDFATADGTATAGNDYTASSGTLTFATGMITQMVTVLIIDDDVADPDETFTVELSNAVNASITDMQGISRIIDNDSAGIAVSPTALTVVESGTTINFTVALNTEPTSDVTVTLTSADVSEAIVSTSTLTFTAANYNLPQTVTVTGVDDAVVDGDQTTSVSLTATGGGYDGQIVTVFVTTNDDDVKLGEANLTITPITLLVAEDAPDQNEFNIALAQAPASGEVIAATISFDGGQLTIAPTTLVFDSSNFNIFQVVSVNAVADGVDEEITQFNVVVTLTSSLGSQSPFDGLSQIVLVTVFDTADSIIIFVPNIGQLTIYGEFPQSVYENPNGNPLHDHNNTAILLPNDSDGNGYDTYTVTEFRREADGRMWMGVFLGSANWGWVEYVEEQTIVSGNVWAMIHN